MNLESPHTVSENLKVQTYKTESPESGKCVQLHK